MEDKSGDKSQGVFIESKITETLPKKHVSRKVGFQKHVQCMFIRFFQSRDKFWNLRIYFSCPEIRIFHLHDKVPTFVNNFSRKHDLLFLKYLSYFLSHIFRFKIFQSTSTKIRKNKPYHTSSPDSFCCHTRFLNQFIHLNSLNINTTTKFWKVVGIYPLKEIFKSVLCIFRF